MRDVHLREMEDGSWAIVDPETGQVQPSVPANETGGIQSGHGFASNAEAEKAADAAGLNVTQTQSQEDTRAESGDDLKAKIDTLSAEDRDRLREILG